MLTRSNRFAYFHFNLPQFFVDTRGSRLAQSERWFLLPGSVKVYTELDEHTFAKAGPFCPSPCFAW